MSQYSGGERSREGNKSCKSYKIPNNYVGI